MREEKKVGDSLVSQNGIFEVFLQLSMYSRHTAPGVKNCKPGDNTYPIRITTLKLTACLVEGVSSE